MSKGLLAGASVGNYALFAGGYEANGVTSTGYDNRVDAYSVS